MKFEPWKTTVKAGHEVILRSAEAGDAEALIEYLKITTAETPYLSRGPEEVTYTVEQEREFIQNILDAERELMLTAFVDGKLAGTSSIMRAGAFKRDRHRCSLGIALYREYWGRGIGRLLMDAVLKAAKEMGYEQAELEVVADNVSAIALYESLGFQKFGHFPDWVKYEDGTYADMDRMMKKL